jgi:hypothetical protein
VTLEFSKHGIGQGNFGVGASGAELDEAFWLTHGEVAEEEGVDESEDSGVGADTESEREDSDSGEDGRFREGAESIAE